MRLPTGNQRLAVVPGLIPLFGLASQLEHIQVTFVDDLVAQPEVQIQGAAIIGPDFQKSSFTSMLFQVDQALPDHIRGDSRVCAISSVQKYIRYIRLVFRPAG